MRRAPRHARKRVPARAGSSAATAAAAPGNRTEVVLVDVSVFDKDNRPIEGLTAADFELEVNGQPRAVQNLQYISTVGTKSISETSPPPANVAALQKNEIAQAASWFQVTLKDASDFLGAAFYLGAVHAASGRDHEAVGAWQMSLIGEGGDRAYPVGLQVMYRRHTDAPAQRRGPAALRGVRCQLRT